MNKRNHITADTPRYTLCYGINGLQMKIKRHLLNKRGTYEKNKLNDSKYPKINYFTKEINGRSFNFKKF